MKRVTDREFQQAAIIFATKIVEDVGVDPDSFRYQEWFDRQVDRLVDEFLLSDTFQDEIADQIIEYNEINERIMARDEEADQALEARREP